MMADGAGTEREGTLLTDGDQAAVWEAVVRISVPELRVAIVEAFQWIELPLSAANMSRLLDHRWSPSLISHHFKALASNGLLRKSGSRPVRGVAETFFVLAV